MPIHRHLLLMKLDPSQSASRTPKRRAIRYPQIVANHGTAKGSSRAVVTPKYPASAITLTNAISARLLCCHKSMMRCHMGSPELVANLVAHEVASRLRRVQHPSRRIPASMPDKVIGTMRSAPKIS